MTYDFDQMIERRHTESSKWHKYGPDVLPMWVADMDFKSPEPVIQALRERVEHGVFGYGMELPEFAEMVVERLQRLYDWQIAPEAVVIVPGVVPGFNVASHAFTSPGDGLLVQTPVYPPILRVPGNARLSCDEMCLTRESDGHYSIDFDRFDATIGERTRMFLLCNPHNPVGRVFQTWELERMAESCLRHDVLICSDEIHCDLIFKGHQHLPIASLAPEIAQRSVTFMAPSKTFNLAGLKCSFAILPDPALRERFKDARLDLVQRMVNIMGYSAALSAYRDGQPWLDDVLHYLEANRDYLFQYVNANLPGIRMAKPEGTYLAWLDCRQSAIPNDDPFTFFLDKAKVAMNDGRTFGVGGEGFVRLNFACPRAMLTQALDRMKTALESL
jgi:cystathionine beta-lyase